MMIVTRAASCVEVSLPGSFGLQAGDRSGSEKKPTPSSYQPRKGHCSARRSGSKTRLVAPHSEWRARFRPLNHGVHLGTIAVERVVHDIQRGDRRLSERKRLRIPAAEARLMHASTATSWRRMAQMLKEPAVPLNQICDQRQPERVIHRDELEQRVVVHFADRGHAGKPPAELSHETP